MRESYVQFENEAKTLIKQYPGFKYHESESDPPELTGQVVLNDLAGIPIDKYNIKIVCSDIYPLRFPLVYETDGRIPVNTDWHVFADGHMCICSFPEEILECNKGITLFSFYQNHVIPYFFNQKHRELQGYFLKERPHGNKGNIEFFQETFKTKNVTQIANLLGFIKLNREPLRVESCFCGSGEKYRKCHRAVFRTFKPLPPKVLDLFITIVSA